MSKTSLLFLVRRDVCGLANCQLGPGVDLADLFNGSLVQCCRSLVLAGDQLNIALVPPCICAINATDARARLTRPHWFIGIPPPSSLWSMTPMIFRSLTTSAKDLDHVPRLVTLAFLLAGWAVSIDLSCWLLLLVIIAMSKSGITAFAQAMSSWIFR